MKPVVGLLLMLEGIIGPLDDLLNRCFESVRQFCEIGVNYGESLYRLIPQPCNGCQVLVESLQDVSQAL